MRPVREALVVVSHTREGRHPALAGVRGGVAEVRVRAGRPTGDVGVVPRPHGEHP